MERLTPCETCARHVRASETHCPFCDSTMRTPSPRRVVRAAILAGVALLAPACGAKHDADPQGRPAATLTAVPPVVPAAATPTQPVEPPSVTFAPVAGPSPEELAAAEQARAAEALAAEEAQRVERRQRARELARNRARQNRNLRMPYGAPPRRDDLV